MDIKKVLESYNGSGLVHIVTETDRFSDGDNYWEGTIQGQSFRAWGEWGEVIVRTSSSADPAVGYRLTEEKASYWTPRMGMFSSAADIAVHFPPELDDPRWGGEARAEKETEAVATKESAISSVKGAIADHFDRG
jgi:hypothetical protein